jgi:GNAT superfamily N-acetyltransferase
MSDQPAIRSIARRWSRLRRLAPHGHDPARSLSLRPGTIHDYDALARHHYRADRPATFVRVLVLLGGIDEPPAAVLVVSMPTLNGSWRAAAFPALAPLLRDKRASARWINANLRAISRVVVDPRWRGLGLAKRIVRAYLRRPCTRFTEAIAAMGAFNPFFERAGMRPFACAIPAPDARLLDALAHARMDVDELTRRTFAGSFPGTHRERFMACELERWSRSSRRDASLVGSPRPEIASAASMRIGARPIAYAHERH